MKNYISLKTLGILCLMLLGSLSVSAQQTQRSVLSSEGSTHYVETSAKTYYVSQSIGQEGIVGTSGSVWGARQGYQQPPITIMRTHSELIPNALNVTVFPNPVVSSVFAVFEKEMSGPISIQLFNIIGQELLTSQHGATQELEVNLSGLATGTYYLKIIASNSIFETKLIKN